MKKGLPYIQAICAGALIAISLPGYDIFPAFAAGLILLFLSLNSKTLLRSILLSAITGITAGLIFNTWSLDASRQYSGSVGSESVYIYFALTIYSALWFALFGAGYFVVDRSKKHSVVQFVVSVPALWVSWDWLYQFSLPSFPWAIPTSYSQWNNFFLIQWASIGGTWLVSFIVVLLSALFFVSIIRKSVAIAALSTGILLVLYGAGYSFSTSESDDQASTVNVTFIQENVAASERWDEAFTDSLAHIFIKLNQEAAVGKPDLICWSETAIPWTFRTDDALVNKVLAITYPTGAAHLIGMLTSADDVGDVYNSIYYINPDGMVTDRYDKRELLTFLEVPLIKSGWILPFRQSRYENIFAGGRPNVLKTKRGVVGALICNEILSAGLSREAVDAGAQLLYVASNDSWFFGSPLLETHIAAARLRAIEFRRDIIFNANRGFVGVIKSSGETDLLPPSTTARTYSVEATMRDGSTLYEAYPDAVAYLSIVLFVFVLISFLTNEIRNRRRIA